MKRLVILAILASSALSLGAVPSAQASLLLPPTNMISSPPPSPPPSGGFSASYTTITPAYFPNIPQSETTFTLGGGSALFGGSTAGAFTVSNLTIDATPFTGNLPPSASGPVNLSNPFTVTDPANGKTATFMFTNPATVTESGAPGSAVMGSLTASVQLISNNDPNLNLSAFANGGTFMAGFSNIDFEDSANIPSVLTLSSFDGGNGVAIYPSGPGLPISFTFTIAPNAGVPEPGSLALWGLAAAAGLGGLRRRLRHRAA